VEVVAVLIVYVLFLAVAAWFLVLRPIRRQRAARAAVESQLAPGVRVMLTSGLLATLLEVDGDEVVLDVGDGVRLRYVSRAIGAVLTGPAGNSEPEPNVTEADPEPSELHERQDPDAGA
jgi:preprotein translocase subunit YajC